MLLLLLLFVDAQQFSQRQRGFCLPHHPQGCVAGSMTDLVVVCAIELLSSPAHAPFLSFLLRTHL